LVAISRPPAGQSLEREETAEKTADASMKTAPPCVATTIPTAPTRPHGELDGDDHSVENGAIAHSAGILAAIQTGEVDIAPTCGRLSRE
jgi:hypothetical protein